MAVSMKTLNRVVDVCRAGGRVEYALERDPYTGREQFQFRVLDKTGARVRGLGFVACNAAVRSGLLYLDPSIPGGSTGRQTWRAI